MFCWDGCITGDGSHRGAGKPGRYDLGALDRRPFEDQRAMTGDHRRIHLAYGIYYYTLVSRDTGS